MDRKVVEKMFRVIIRRTCLDPKHEMGTARNFYTQEEAEKFLHEEKEITVCPQCTINKYIKEVKIMGEAY